MNYKNILKKVGEKVGRCITFRDLTCGGSTSTDFRGLSLKSNKYNDVRRPNIMRKVGVMGFMFLIVLGMSFTPSQINDIPSALAASYSFTQEDWASGANTSGRADHGVPTLGQPASGVTSFYSTSSPYMTTGANVSLATTTPDSFTQTDWVGGESATTANNTSTGWTLASTTDNSIATSTAGQLTLKATAGSKAAGTDTDAFTGIPTNTQVNGSGASASVKLILSFDNGTGVNGDFDTNTYNDSSITGITGTYPTITINTSSVTNTDSATSPYRDTTVTPNVVIYNFQNFDIRSGHTVNVTGSYPVVIKATGNVTIASTGILNLNGGNGGSASGGIDGSAGTGVAGGSNGGSGSAGSGAGPGSIGGGAMGGGCSGSCSAKGGGGGGYATTGGTGQTGVVGGSSYGNADLSTLYGGSGGGAGGDGGYGGHQGGGGGGAGGVKISTRGAITINGTIRANGGSGGAGDSDAQWLIDYGDNKNGGGGGGGAGGSVFLQGNTIDVTGGTVTAVAGNGNTTYSTGGNGSVGRIRLDYITTTGSGTISPATGYTVCPSGCTTASGLYTSSGSYTSAVYDTGQKNDFTTASWTAITTGADTFTHTSDGDFDGTNASTIVSGNSVILMRPDPTIPNSPVKKGFCISGNTDSRCTDFGTAVNLTGGSYYYTSFYIQSGVTVTVPTGGSALIINANDNVVIDGVLQANGGNGVVVTAGAAGAGGSAGGAGNGTFGNGTLGFGNGGGGGGIPVLPDDGAGGGGGGGFGGLGGTGGGSYGATGGSAGPVNGTISNGGSGGGGGSADSSSRRGGGGGGGGGRIQITTNQIITIGSSGFVYANGGTGGSAQTVSGGGGGGGSGGSIKLEASRIVNNNVNASGSLRANGGSGGSVGPTGGGGGGGRILLIDSDGAIEGSGTISRAQGTGGIGATANTESYTQANPSYASSGIYTSAIKEIGTGAKFKSVAWAETLNGQTITMKVRTCNDSACSGEAAFSTLSNLTNNYDYSASLPNGVTNGDGWIQYEVTLSGNGLATPTLESVTITTIPLVLEMRAGPNNTDCPGACTGWTEWNEIGSGATGSSSLGATYDTAFDGKQWIQYRAKFSTANTAYTPSLDDITFNYQYYPVDANYSLVSSAFNTEDTANTISSISWNGATTTAASIKFQMRATSSEALLSGTNWCGPTVCDGTEYFTDSYNGSAITNTALTAGSGAQWFQYKAILLTTESNQTPTLSDATVSYKRKLYGGTYELVSSPYNTGDPANVMGSVAMNVGALPSGTTAKIQIKTASTQDGIASAVWCAIDCSGSTYFTASAAGVNSFINSFHTSLQDSSGDQWWQYKIILTPSADSLDAPIINSVDVVYVINTAPTVSVTSATVQTSTDSNDGRVTVVYDLSDAETDNYEAYLFYDIGITLTSDNTTTLTVSDTSKLPTAPNYIQIGSEVIKYGAIVNGTTLGTLTRGTADGSWPGGSTRHTKPYTSGNTVWIKAGAVTGDVGSVTKATGKQIIWTPRSESNLNNYYNASGKVRVLIHDSNVANQLSSQNGNSADSGTFVIDNTSPTFGVLPLTSGTGIGVNIQYIDSDGDSVADSRDVTIRLTNLSESSAVARGVHLLFSNDGVNFGTATTSNSVTGDVAVSGSYEFVSADALATYSKAWTLVSGGSRVKNVYIKVKDVYGNVISSSDLAQSATIIYNKSPQFEDVSLSDADASGYETKSNNKIVIRQCNIYDTDANCSAGKIKIKYSVRDPDAGESAFSPQGKIHTTFAYSVNGGNTFSTSKASELLATAVATSTVETVGADASGNYNPAYTTLTAYWNPANDGISASQNIIVRASVTDNEITYANSGSTPPTPGSPAVYATSNTIAYDVTKPANASPNAVEFDAGIAGSTGTNNIAIYHPDDATTTQYMISGNATDGSLLTQGWTTLSGASPLYINWGFDTAIDTKSVNIKFRDAYGNTQTSTTTASTVDPIDPATFLIQDVSKIDNIIWGNSQWRIYIGWGVSTSPIFDYYQLEYATSTSVGGPYSDFALLPGIPITDSTTSYYVHDGLHGPSSSGTNDAWFYKYRLGIKDDNNNTTVRTYSYSVDADGAVTGRANGIQDQGEGGGGTITSAAASVVTNIVPTQGTDGNVTFTYQITDSSLTAKTSPSYEGYILYDLGVALTASSTTALSVSDASKMPSSGHIQINQEIIKYTGKSGNDLTGITRGTWPTTGTTRVTRVNETMASSTPVWIVASSTQTSITNTSISSGQSGTITWTTSNNTNLSGYYLNNIGIRVLVHDNQRASSGPVSSQSDLSNDGVLGLLDLKPVVISSDSLKINGSASSIEAPPANTVSLSLQNITTDTASETLYIQFASSTPAVWRGAKNNGTLDMTENSWGEATSTVSLSTASWVWPMSGRSEGITVRIKDSFGNISTTTDSNSIIKNAPAEFTTVTLADADASNYESKSNAGIVIRQCNIYDTDLNCSQGKVKVKLQVRDPDASDSLLATKGTIHTTFLLSVAGSAYATTTTSQLLTTYSEISPASVSQDADYGTSTVSQLGANSTATGGVSDIAVYDPQYTEVIAYISSIGQSGSLRVKAVVTDNEVGTTPQNAESNTIQYDITAPPATTMTFDAGAGVATIPVPTDATTTQYIVYETDTTTSAGYTTLTSQQTLNWSFDSGVETKSLEYRFRDIYGNLQTSTTTISSLVPPDGSLTRVEDVSTASSNRIFLGWEQSSSGSFSAYRLEYATSSDDVSYGAYSELITIPYATLNFYTHSGLNSAYYYRYKLSVKNTSNNWSVKSVKNSNSFVMAKPDGTLNGDEVSAQDVSAPSISNAQATTTEATISTIEWGTNEVSDSAVTYSTSSDAISALSGRPSASSANITLVLQSAFVTSTSTDPTNANNMNYYRHAVALTTLSPGTTYYFKVWSQDATGNSGASSSLTFDTAGGPAIQATTIKCNGGVCSDLDAYKITSSSVTIAWDTCVSGGSGNLGCIEANQSNSYVNYKSSASDVWLSVSSADVNAYNHSVTLPNLSNGVYEFYVKSTNSLSQTSRYPSGYPAASSMKFKIGVARPVIVGVPITVPPDANAPSCSATQSSITANWVTDQSATTEIAWSLAVDTALFDGSSSNQYPSASTLGCSGGGCTDVSNYHSWRKTADKSRIHSYTLTGLTEDTLYYVKVRSSNGQAASAGENDTSDTYTYTACRTSAKEVVTETIIIRQPPVEKDVTAPTMSTLSVFNITANSAMIEWKTDENSDSLVEYGLSSVYGKIVGALTDFITDHRVGIAGIEPQTAYHFRATSMDASGNRSYSSDQTFTTLSLEEQSKISEKELSDIKKELEETKAQAEEVKKALTPEELKEREEILEKAIQNVNEILNTLTQDVSLEVLEENLISTKETIDAIAKSIPAPVIIGGVPDVKVEGTTATISWRTNKEANSIIGYAKEDAYDPNKTEPYSTEAGQSEEEAKEHKVVLTNLSPASVYHFQIRSKSKLGPTGRSRDFVFQTSMEEPEILEYSFKEITENSFTVSWKTNVPMTSLVEYTPFKNGALQTTLSGTQGRPEFSPLHEIKVANIVADTLFNIAISGLDIVGNKVSKSIGTIRTIKDVKAPQISKTRSESSLFPGKEEKAQTLIFWETDEPSTSQVFWKEGVGKGELLSSTKIDQELTTQHVVVISDFKPGMVYRFQVESKDPTGNRSRSTDYTVLTPKKGQTVIDLIITNFQDIFGFLGKLQ